MKHYSIVFNTTNGTRRSIKVNNPTLGLSEGELSAAVNQILANDVFNPAKGGLDSLHRMELSVVERSVVLQ